jgi:oligoribonuclease NrnB/cAMP/cGMP phosphodiesterase (DHH superfamily)
MFELSKTKDFTWIDHHVSVIKPYEEALAKGDYQPLKGIRRVGTAAIELTWEYFHPNEPTPRGVKLLALSDIFDLRDDRVRPFEYAFQSLGANMPEDKNWTALFNEQINIEEMVEKGRAILSWIRVRNYRSARTMVFESEFQGLKCLCSNMAYGYSEFFDSIEDLDKYDFTINFYMNKNNKWNMTFYGVKEDMDVSKIAAMFGGGGHKGAAGASSQDKLPDFLTKGKPKF